MQSLGLPHRQMAHLPSSSAPCQKKGAKNATDNILSDYIRQISPIDGLAGGLWPDQSLLDSNGYHNTCEIQAWVGTGHLYRSIRYVTKKSSLHASPNLLLSSARPPWTITASPPCCFMTSAANHPRAAGAFCSGNAALLHVEDMMLKIHTSFNIFPAPACPRDEGSRSPNMVTRALSLLGSRTARRVATLRASGPWTPSEGNGIVFNF